MLTELFQGSSENKNRIKMNRKEVRGRAWNKSGKWKKKKHSSEAEQIKSIKLDMNLYMISHHEEKHIPCIGQKLWD